VSEQEFEGFIGLEEADKSRGGIERARRERGWRGVRPEAAVAGAVLCVQERDLAFKAGDGAINPRGVGIHASGINHFACFYIVRSIDDDVEIFDDGACIAGVEALIEDIQFQVIAQGLERISRAPGFGEVEAGHTVEDLSGQVGQVHNVSIHQPQLPHACGGQVEGDGGAQASHTDN